MRYALLILLSACGLLSQQPIEPAAEPMELRSYDLPPGTADRVHALLQRVADGRVEQGLHGDVVVLAAPSVHEGVEDIVEAVRADPPKLVQQRNVRMDYWLVRARPGTADAEPGLAPVSKALEAIEASDGQQVFTLFSRESLLSAEDGEAEAKGARSKIGQITSISPDGLVLASLDMTLEGGSATSTSVKLRPGQLLVLGHIGVLDERFGPTPDAEPSSLYIIVRATIVEAL